MVLVVISEHLGITHTFLMKRELSCHTIVCVSSQSHLYAFVIFISVTIMSPHVIVLHFTKQLRWNILRRMSGAGLSCIYLFLISHNQACTVMGTNVFRSSRLNEFKQVMVRYCEGLSFHMFAPLKQNSWRSNSFWQKESSVPYESIASFHEYA